MVIELFVYYWKIEKLLSKKCILVLVVDIMLKSLLLKKLELLYQDNLIKCETKSKFI